MKTRIHQSITLGLVLLIGLLFCGNARAQIIGVQDGSTNVVYTSQNSTSVSANNFTVTSGASVLVVLLYDRDQAIGLSPTSLSWGSQTLTRGVTENNGTSHYADSDIFYLFNPTPGQNTITATDTSGTTPSAMTMQVYSLSNVNTSITPVAYANFTTGFGTVLSLNLAATTPVGAWAAFTASYGDSGAGQFDATSTSGIAGIEYEVNNQSQLMGGIAQLSPGPTTISEFDTDGGQQTAMAALVFAPVVVEQPGVIYLQDGSSQIATSSGSTSVGTNVTVTSGASVLVVNVFSRDNSTSDGLPTTLSWGSQTLTRAVSENNGAATYAWDDIYYLYNPTAGTNTVTATDTSRNTPSAMDMQFYTLNGVNTSFPPTSYGNNNADLTSTLSTSLTNTTPPGVWADVNSSYGTGETTGPAVLSTSGLVNVPEIENSTSQMMGYIANLAGGATTITSEANADGVQKIALSIAVFEPNITGPSAPASLTATTGQTNMVPLSWPASAGATGYLVLRSATSNANYIQIATTSGNASTNYTDTSVSAYVTYYYVVQAVDASGSSLYSPQATATPVAIPLSAPSGLVAIGQTNQVYLSWTDASGGRSTNYIILRSITSGGPYQAIATNLANASTTFTDQTVYDFTTYYYVLESYAGVASTNSLQASATPVYALPNGEAGTSTLLDGGLSTITTVASGAGSTISVNYTVSPEAGVMVIELWDKNTEANHTSPSFVTWSNNTTGTAQNAIRAVSESSASGVSSDCDIYYLYNPFPGSGTISATDTNAVTIDGMSMMAFDLAGVNTTVQPVVYATNSSSASALSVATASTTPGGSWAAVMSFDGNAGGTIVNSANSGTSTYQDVANGQNQALGYASGLKAGSSTISMSATGGASQATLAAALFTPAIGTGIYLQDGTVLAPAPYSIGAGVSNVVDPFTVTEGASVMVVEVYDNNNYGPSSNPSIEGPVLVWSNETFGTSQLLTLCVATNTTQYTWTWADIYYLVDPLPGVGVITGADMATTHNYVQVVPFTLGGVDTTSAPFTAANGNTSANVLSVTTSPSQVFGSWAACISVNYNGGGGNNIIFSANSGGAVESNPHPNGLQVASGYITNLAAGSTPVYGTATGSVTHMDLSVAVFAALPGTAAPVNLTATGQTNQIVLSWADASSGLATSYVLQRSVDDINFTSIATLVGNASTSFTDTNVLDWTTYYYQVQANGPGGLSLFSAQASANAVGLAAVPQGFTASAGVGEVILNWSSQLGATSFTILRSLTSGGSFNSIGSSSTLSFTDTGVTDGTQYFYELSATNSFGASSNSAQASAIPAVTFFTNWIGIFNGGSDTAGWVPFLGEYADASSPTGNSPDSQDGLADSLGGPGYGISSSSLVFDAYYGPFGTDDQQGIATNFPTPLNVSTYQNIEMDIIGAGTFDGNSQIQAVQPELQVPVGGVPTYETGTYPSIALDQPGSQFPSGTGNVWTHYVIPVTNWSAYNLTALSSFGLSIFDTQFATSTEIDVGFANIEFTGAPGYSCSISVTNQTVATGTPDVTLMGTVSGTVGGTNIGLAINTPVSATINGTKASGTVVDGTGDFSIVFPTGSLANNVYPITYAAATDYVELIGATNTATTLTITTVLPVTRTNILAPYVASGNVVVRIETVSGHTYYLLSTTNLAPPVVWTTNATTAGTGGIITNLVPISGKDLFLEYKAE